MSQERITRLCEAVLADLTVAKEGFERALQPGQPNVFVWHGEVFWVDRVRGFIAPGDRDARPPDTFSPDDDELDIYAGEYQRGDTGSLSRMWAHLLSGSTARTVWEIDAAKFLNLAVAQPRINPAFGPLFWIFLAEDMGPGPVWDHSENLFTRVRPMIYRLSDYPALTPSPEEVRSAQIGFLEGMFPGTTDASCQQLSDVEWAARCEEQLRLHQDLVDYQFFTPLLERIGALDEPGARPFE
jgi:hypothetical protein